MAEQLSYIDCQDVPQGPGLVGTGTLRYIPTINVGNYTSSPMTMMTGCTTVVILAGGHVRASAGALAVHTALILAGGHVRASAGALAVHTALR